MDNSYKKVTGVAFISTSEGKRVSFSYSVINEDGDVLQKDVRQSFIAMDKNILKKLSEIEEFIETKKLDQ